MSTALSRVAAEPFSPLAEQSAGEAVDATDVDGPSETTSKDLTYITGSGVTEGDVETALARAISGLHAIGMEIGDPTSVEQGAVVAAHDDTIAVEGASSVRLRSMPVREARGSSGGRRTAISMVRMPGGAHGPAHVRMSRQNVAWGLFVLTMCGWRCPLDARPRRSRSTKKEPSDECDER